jgi:hypothetical protein
MGSHPIPKYMKHAHDRILISQNLTDDARGVVVCALYIVISLYIAKVTSLCTTVGFFVFFLVSELWWERLMRRWRLN